MAASINTVAADQSRAPLMSTGIFVFNGLNVIV